MIRQNRVLIVVLLVLIVGCVWWLGYYKQQTGVASLNFQLPDTHDLGIRLNDKTILGYQSPDDIKLHTGRYKLSVNKPGYKDFSLDFTITKSQKLVINIAMQPNKPQTAKAAGAVLTNDILTLLTDVVSINQTSYFYNNTWAVATVESKDGDVALIVASYDGTSNSWHTELGPGTSFDPGDLSGLPADITSYLSKQSYINQEEVDE